MDLKKDIELILSKPVDEVINSSLSLVLLRCYSLIYLGGKQCQACAKSQRSYYYQIQTNGLRQLEIMETAINKTCKLKTDNLVYISPLQNHYSNVNITDEIALNCLSKGYLKESDFETLPEAYQKKVTHPDIIGEVAPIVIKKAPAKTKAAK